MKSAWGSYWDCTAESVWAVEEEKVKFRGKEVENVVAHFYFTLCAKKMPRNSMRAAGRLLSGE